MGRSLEPQAREGDAAISNSVIPSEVPEGNEAEESKNRSLDSFAYALSLEMTDGV